MWCVCGGGGRCVWRETGEPEETTQRRAKRVPVPSRFKRKIRPSRITKKRLGLAPRCFVLCVCGWVGGGKGRTTHTGRPKQRRDCARSPNACFFCLNSSPRLCVCARVAVATVMRACVEATTPSPHRWPFSLRSAVVGQDGLLGLRHRLLLLGGAQAALLGALHVVAGHAAWLVGGGGGGGGGGVFFCSVLFSAPAPPSGRLPSLNPRSPGPRRRRRDGPPAHGGPGGGLGGNLDGGGRARGGKGEGWGGWGVGCGLEASASESGVCLCGEAGRGTVQAAGRHALGC